MQHRQLGGASDHCATGASHTVLNALYSALDGFVRARLSGALAVAVAVAVAAAAAATIATRPAAALHRRVRARLCLLAVAIVHAGCVRANRRLLGTLAARILDDDDGVLVVATWPTFRSANLPAARGEVTTRTLQAVASERIVHV